MHRGVGLELGGDHADLGRVEIPGDGPADDPAEQAAQGIEAPDLQQLPLARADGPQVQRQIDAGIGQGAERGAEKEPGRWGAGSGRSSISATPTPQPTTRPRQ